MVRLLALGSALAALSAVANACYEQCGGQGYTGPTTCSGGCVCTYSNPWYSQCLPSTATSTSQAVSTLTTSSGPTPTGGVKYIFSFGDSYTSTGFNANGAKPNNANPIGNPAYPGSTTCGAVINWIDVVTAKYNTSLAYTYNYAVGGATIDRDLVAPYGGVTLEDQVATFMSTVSSKPASTPWTSTNALFSIFIGINDIGRTWTQGGDRSAFSDTLLNAYFGLVEQLYNVGGRNFLFVNVPGVERSPQLLGQSASNRATLKSIIDTFNTKLAAKVSAFQSSHSGTKTWVYNSNAKLVSILNSPTSYGFKDATSYGSASNLAWCDNYHISPGVHDIYGKDVAALIKGGFF